MMSYFGNYGSFPQQQAGGCGTQSIQQQQYLQPQQHSQFAGLASYGGPSAYSVAQPQYYAGPSYSTTSDNDFCNQSSQPNGNYSAYATGCQAAGQPAQYSYPQQQQSLDQYTAYTKQYQPQQYVPQPRTSSQANLATSQSQQQCGAVGGGDDELNQIQPQIEAAYEAATGQRRQPVIKRQVITIPGAPGRVQQVVRRLPTPTPDVVERVFVVKPQRDVVNLIIERPCTPPAQYRDRTIMGKQRKPVINPFIVRVQGRPQCQQQQPQQICYQSQYVQALPAPPLLNVQSVRVPPSSSYLSNQQPQQHPCQSASQPSLSAHQCAQQQQPGGQLSHQASHSQLQHQLSQPQLAQSGYVVAPVQYADQQQFGGYSSAAQFGAGYSTGFPLNQNYYPSSGLQQFQGFNACGGGF